MIVARFKHPVNMGDNAHEVRLFMLIVTPSKDKGTKNTLETGRTFATMLTDANFRQRLLEARGDTEFKSLMMVRAQQLSKAKSMKNRHKYTLEPAVHQSISTLNNTNLAGANNKMDEWQPSGSFAKLAIKQNDDENNNSNACANGNSTLIDNTTRALFAKNPRASKLLELISQTTNNQHQPADKELEAEVSANKIDAANHSSTDQCDLLMLCKHIEFGKGLWHDFRRRARYYISDYKDAFVGPPKTVQKTVATIWFLYFGILLPTIAFSALNTAQTHGHMGDLRKAILGQAIGGLGFALFGGQPLVIIMTTAPLCLYTKG